MLDRFGTYIRFVLRYLDRAEFLVSAFALPKKELNKDRRGLIIIQIDALSRKQLEAAMAKGRIPFLKKLLDKERYRLHTHYPGMPCSTAAVQAELFYGVKSAVPAFSFYDYESKRVFKMFNPKDALEIESRLEKQGRGLMSGGSAYSNIYSGGADESHFCISKIAEPGVFSKMPKLGFLLALLLYSYSLLRTCALVAIEFVIAVYDFFAGVAGGHDFAKELKFIPSRVGMCIVLRELVTIGVKIDIARRMPVIHLNLMGYHEQSHRRGAESLFAHWTLRGIDDAIKRIWQAAKSSKELDYDIWIYSDHGQETTVPYQKKFGKIVQQAVEEAFGGVIADGYAPSSHSDKNNFSRRLRFSKSNKINNGGEVLEECGCAVTAMGPMGNIYLPDSKTDIDKKELARKLIENAGIPLVFIPGQDGQIQVEKPEGSFVLPRDGEKIFDTRIPFWRQILDDFIEALRKPNIGDLIISGWQGPSQPYYTFAMECGSHGGMAEQECRGFAFLPNRILRDKKDTHLRPTDIRNAALEVIESSGKKIVTAAAASQKTLRIMTYNVHSCRGTDGFVLPQRIAKVIELYEPDVIALQELDVERMRTGGIDQAELIAKQLNMDHFFHPLVLVEQEKFGDAILSTRKIELVKNHPLSKLPDRKKLEQRGAIWVRIELDGVSVQLLNTHLGLFGRERLHHIRELLDGELLGSKQCQTHTVLCGDFNALPSWRTCRLLNERFENSREFFTDRLKRTWPGRHPHFCLDHIFVSRDMKVTNAFVADDYLSRIASDHRPVIADVSL
ncbi:MAG: endonuclease/exonuclease/phosphatase family protein [Phycisphaerae bacterium]|jgi:endonuclease/exonuclease/phosphatase family metal-dependent hydrolase